MPTVEIYRLADPHTGAIRYVGKANDSKQRLKRHIIDARRRRTPIANWIRKIIASGACPVIVGIQTVPADSWQQHERDAIAKARADGHPILNIADGGDQPFCPKEIRQQNARNATQSRVSTPIKAQMYRMKRDLGVLLHHGYVREDTKEFMRRAAQEFPDILGVWATIK